MTRDNAAQEEAIDGLVEALVVIVIGHAFTCDCPVCDRLHDALHATVLAAQHEAEASDDD